MKTDRSQEDAAIRPASPAEGKNNTSLCIFVWLARLFVGAVFVVSGWAKAVDPSGFIIKTGEYLAAWNLQVPHEAIVAGCMALAAVEFATGILVATGCLKRVAVWCAAAIMAFMLPLTAYIFVANPVADCGCFGDLFIISNGATFAKNIVISAVIVFLIMRNRSIGGAYAAPVQWLVATVSLAFPLLLSFIGYHVQPVVDFRPFTLGTTIFHPVVENNDAPDPTFVYEKDGQRRTFSLDQLPDDSWAYVETQEVEDNDTPDIAVRDEDGDDISTDLVSESDPQVWLIVPDPGMQFLSRSHMVNELYRYLRDRQIDFTAVVGNRGAAFQYWVDLTRPTFPVYSAEDTALQQLVRGSAAIVYTRAGKIVWKRTLSSIPDKLLQQTPQQPDLDQPNVLDNVEPIDDGRLAISLAFIFLAVLVGLYLLSLSPKLLRLITAR